MLTAAYRMVITFPLIEVVMYGEIRNIQNGLIGFVVSVWVHKLFQRVHDLRDVVPQHIDIGRGRRTICQ